MVPKCEDKTFLEIDTSFWSKPYLWIPCENLVIFHFHNQHDLIMVVYVLMETNFVLYIKLVQKLGVFDGSFGAFLKVGDKPRRIIFGIVVENIAIKILKVLAFGDFLQCRF